MKIYKFHRLTARPGTHGWNSLLKGFREEHPVIQWLMTGPRLLHPNIRDSLKQPLILGVIAQSWQGVALKLLQHPEMEIPRLQQTQSLPIIARNEQEAEAQLIRTIPR